MGKGKPAKRGKKRFKKQQQSVFVDTDGDSDCERPRSAYEQHHRIETAEKSEVFIEKRPIRSIGQMARRFGVLPRWFGQIAR